MKGAVVLRYELDERGSFDFVHRRAEEIRCRLRQHRDVFFGYCSRVDNCAANITAYLESNGLSVLDWPRDFRVRRTILEEVKRAATLGRCGLFLFTAADPLDGVSTRVAIPRDNVILETGYFISAHDPGRVVVVQEKGAKMPADLGGLICLNMDDRAKWGEVAEKFAESLHLAMENA